MSYLEKLFNLKNKVVVITGGSGLLGTEYVKAFREAESRVAILDIKKPKTSLSESVKFFQTDITKKKEVKETLQEIEKIWNTPDVLINNAAIDFPPTQNKVAFEDYSLEEWQKVLEVNLTGMLICCQVIGSAMAKKKQGGIINISSIYGMVSPDQRIYQNFIKPVSYSVTKAGVLGLTRYLATYLAPQNVRVNALILGGVENNQPPEFIKNYSERTPLSRMARKDESVGAALFLASSASSYMTGSHFVVDGGWTAW